ncbi:hypothetical protein [Sphaerothrix gracilis]|uniref:hypothetical protein n=1 Tax=Sphaerothrix gracilis TaxID=3151835 RepID=UPI0031FC7F41
MKLRKISRGLDDLGDRSKPLYYFFSMLLEASDQNGHQYPGRLGKVLQLQVEVGLVEP